MRFQGKTIATFLVMALSKCMIIMMTFHLSLVITSQVFCLLSVFLKFKFLRIGHASYSLLYSV